LLPSGPGGFTEYNCEATSRATIAKQSIEIFKIVASLLHSFKQVYVSID